MTKVIVSIVTWNSAHSIEACVRSVLLQTFIDYELYIVDNASKDDTCAVIEKIGDKKVNLIRFEENKGFCGGHNHIIKLTKSEFMILVNPDIIMQPDYIANAVKTISEKNNIGTVCGLLLQGPPENKDTLIDSTGLILLPSGIMSLSNHGKKVNEVKLQQQEMFGADGALPFYRRAMIDHVSINGNFFDELFFAHKEDWDVSWRSNTYGWKTVFDPTCIAIHPRVFKPGDRKVRKSMSEQIKIDAVKNQLILLKKNLSTRDLFKNFFTIVPRQMAVFCYILLFERSSLKAYGSYLHHKREIKNSRKIIMAHRNTAPKE